MANHPKRFEIDRWDSELNPSKNELKERIKGKFGIVCTPLNTTLDKEVIAAAGENDLKVVSTVSTGLNHLDIEELKSRNIRVGFGYTPDVSVPAVAEHAIALLLATGRRVVEAHNAILNTFEAKVNNLDAMGDSALIILITADKLGAEFQSLDFIITESDFIIVALAQTAQTKGIFNRARINSMKSNAILINIARGDLLDEAALIEALQNKKIAGAGLDVFHEEPLPLDNPFMKLHNVVLSPHIAYNTHDCRKSMEELAALNVLAVLNGDKMPAEVL
ncbi:glyoxylate reductase/hydroxypyruvate reductase-like [Planococcus citri]|uniref:glyoxylate reductase/hydroxypyruvate reductase-like n=1 Tax=Planococcus citri TaxID=170843 RepID=UPI0031F854B5